MVFQNTWPQGLGILESLKEIAVTKSWIGWKAGSSGFEQVRFKRFLYQKHSGLLWIIIKGKSYGQQKNSHNHKDGFYRGELIKRGQVYTGRKLLSIETGLSEQNIKTSLKKLKRTNHITSDSTNHRSIITLKNYNKYQQGNQQTNQQVTSNQPTGNQQVTTYNKNNNEKNNKYIQ